MIEFTPATGGYSATWNYNDRLILVVTGKTREECLQHLVDEVKKFKEKGTRYEELL